MKYTKMFTEQFNFPKSENAFFLFLYFFLTLRKIIQIQFVYLEMDGFKGILQSHFVSNIDRC